MTRAPEARKTKGLKGIPPCSVRNIISPLLRRELHENARDRTHSGTGRVPNMRSEDPNIVNVIPWQSSISADSNRILLQGRNLAEPK
jgi:hypothetical protein